MKRILLLSSAAAMMLAASPVFAGRHPGQAQTSAPRVGSTTNRVGPGFNRNGIGTRNWNASRNFSASRNFNGNWRRHCHNRFFFAGSFGYPFYPFGYPYYDYYSYPYLTYSTYYPDSYETIYNGSPQSSYDDGPYRGRRGSIVLEVQRRLAREGFYQGSLDGAMGSRTHYAIRAYERSHGLRVDGEINDELLGAMGLR